MGKVVGLVVAILFVFIIFFGSFYTINQGDRGVILRNGAVIGEAEPGLGFKLPIIDGVQEINVQDQKAAFEKVPVYSHDQQPATMTVSINYHITDARALYTEYKNEENMMAKLVSPQVLTWSENVFGQYEAATAVQERAKLNAEIAAAILKHVVGGPLVITSVQVEQLEFSTVYEKAVEARMAATVKQQQAVSEANAVKAKADGDAYSMKVRGDAEASAIRARGDALRDNPGLPALVVAEKWNGNLPETMVPGGGVPFLGLK